MIMDVINKYTKVQHSSLNIIRQYSMQPNDNNIIYTCDHNFLVFMVHEASDVCYSNGVHGDGSSVASTIHSR